MRQHKIDSDTAQLPYPVRKLRRKNARKIGDGGKVKLRLYVAGDAPNSTLARINLYAMFKAHVWEDHEIEVVDLLKSPERGILDRIRMAPTLLKLTPGPVVRIVGTLSEPRRVLRMLGFSDRIP